jgi:hypothetical protein
MLIIATLMLIMATLAAVATRKALDGYPMEMFEAATDDSGEEVDEEQLSDLQCGVCRNVMKYPMVLPCGHSFCRYCIEAWYAMGSSKSCRYFVLGHMLCSRILLAI